MADIHDNAEKDYMGGMKYQDIADKYNVTINTVKSWKKRYAWDRKKGAHKNEKGCTQNRAHKENGVLIEDGTRETLQNDELTPKQQMFCSYYIRSFNATQSYLKAFSCSYNSARTHGYELLQKVAVKREIDRLKEIKRQMIVVGESDIVDLQMRIAFSDLADIADYDAIRMTPKSPKSVDTQLIKKIKETQYGISIELEDRQKAIEWLSKYFLMHPDDKYKAEYDRKKSGDNNRDALEKLDDYLGKMGGVV